MTTRKRNEWLEADESDDSDQGYDSVEESRGKVLAGRASKRRKFDADSEPELPDEDDELSHEDGQTAGDEHGEGDKDEPERIAEEMGESNPAAAAISKKSSKKLKPLTQKQLLASQKASSKTGVIYISRVPPFMKPQAVKHLLSPYGEIGRIFLTPEDPAAHTRRVKAGGNKKRSFTDGWVEFLDKKNAKIVAETLNAQIIGGKKGGWYHDDVWNIKYLKGFKWHHLTEQIANENAERAARLRAEIAQTIRENKLFLQNLEKAKMLDGIKAKRKKKQDGEDSFATPVNDEVVSVDRSGKDFRRQFRQNEVKLKTAKDKTRVEQPEEVKRVLSKIF
ncbi:hypothetical protein AOQ84DRAFT_309436 [Glonium stellatum]|uniref:18S rRNA factor 2 n=1 Tax=Glonium stellatum TaxID=574774 RepID=A0A8E2FBW1_9PEZI|nr:hypothetical protein AOQ84DRAFT_309436 [Glonium stellatum]